MSKIPIRINTGKKIKTVGQIIDGTLGVFNRKKSKHYFRKYDGWAVSTSALELLEKYQVPYVIIKERENQEIFQASVKKFKEKGQVLHPNLTKEDEQVVLPQSEFQKL